jgi:hypothetical protein
MFSDAHSFNTRGGLFNSAARDLHVHYYNRSGQGDDGQQHRQTLNTLSTLELDALPGNASEENAGVLQTNVFIRFLTGPGK